MKNSEETFTIIVKTMAGLEAILAHELRGIGVALPELLTRAVQFKGNTELMYKANFLCRTALRVLKVVSVSEVRDEDELYKAVQGIDWSEYITADQTLAVNAVVNQHKITHSLYAALKTKDAIVDQFRDKTGKRPSVDLENADLRINLHLSGDRCTISLDSSGDSLHRRGYRKVQGEAPISEVLAAGMVMLAGWKGQTPLFDPMCGSGTILTEALMIARNIPAGHFRNGFDFEKWKNFDSQLWEKIKTDGRAGINDNKFTILGSDQSMRAIDATRVNLKSAGFSEDIKLKIINFQDSHPEAENGTIITNPPYGERMQKEDLNGFYSMIGDVLKKKYSGYEAWLITSDFSALKSVGLKPSKKATLYNGPLECRFVKYELYSGSKKAKWQIGNESVPEV